MSRRDECEIIKYSITIEQKEKETKAKNLRVFNDIWNLIFARIYSEDKQNI